MRARYGVPFVSLNSDLFSWISIYYTNTLMDGLLSAPLASPENGCNAMWAGSDMVNFVQNTHNRHPIAYPLGWAMGCLWEFKVWSRGSILVTAVLHTNFMRLRLVLQTQSETCNFWLGPSTFYIFLCESFFSFMAGNFFSLVLNTAAYNVVNKHDTPSKKNPHSCAGSQIWCNDTWTKMATTHGRRHFHLHFLEAKHFKVTAI